MEWLHIFGICPDHVGHPNALDYFLLNFKEISWYFQKNILHLCIIKIKKLWEQIVNITETYLNGLKR